MWFNFKRIDVMKGKYLLYFFVLSLILVLIGVFFKINHLSTANLFLLLGLILQGITILLVFIKYWESFWTFLQK